MNIVWVSLPSGTAKGGVTPSEGLICFKSAETSLCRCYVDTFDLTFQCLILPVEYKLDLHFQS